MPFILTLFAQVQPSGSTPVWLPLLIIVILLLLFWWGMTRNTIPVASETHDSHGGDDHGGDDHGHDAEAAHTIEAHAHDTQAEAATIAPAPAPAPVAPPPAPAAPAQPDDLKKIEGIGPKIESVLNEAGISTFAQVAETAVSDLERIVKEEGGVRLAFPETWPEQAKLAAAGDWAGLEKLQDELDGGRRA